MQFRLKVSLIFMISTSEDTIIFKQENLEKHLGLFKTLRGHC